MLVRRYHKETDAIKKLVAGFLCSLAFVYLGVTGIASAYGGIGIAWTGFALLICVLYACRLVKVLLQKRRATPGEPEPQTQVDVRYAKQQELYHLCKDYDRKLLSRQEYLSERKRLLNELGCNSDF